MQTLEELDSIINLLKNADVEGYQKEAIEAIEKAVNALEVSKRNIYTLQIISSKIIPKHPNEWRESECFHTCVDLAKRALSKSEPKEYWKHDLND